MNKYRKIGLALFDLETTGLKKNKDYIIQIACYCLGFDLKNKTCTPISGVFYTGVKPCKIPKEKGHQIKCIPGAPKLGLASQNFINFLEMNLKPFEHNALVAHNGNRFDIPFLISSMDRLGMNGKLKLESIGVTHRLDTLDLVRQQNEINFDNHKLGTVYQTLNGKPLENAHNALADTEALLSIFEQDAVLKQIDSCLKKF